MKSRIQQLNNWLDSLRDKRYIQRINLTSLVLWNLFIIITVTLLLGTTFVGAAGAGYFVSLVEGEPEYTEAQMKEEVYNYEETSEVYFANDVYLGELPSILERREVELENVSNYVQAALISTEDEYFYEHNGIVPKAIMRATFQEFVDTGMQTGGSTLTQQIVKNQMLSSEVSFDRKAREMMIAMRLENYLDKDDILEAYLNIVPFGRNAGGTQIAGIQAAANGIFDVEASELNLPQSAFIAGIPQNPFSYTPFDGNGDLKEDLTAGLSRMNTVLYRMVDAGMITVEEYEEARDYDIVSDFTDSAPRNSFERYPYITNELERRAIPILRDYFLEKDGVDLSEYESEERESIRSDYYARAETQLRLGGYRIHSTINKDIYDAMEEAVENGNLFGPNSNDGSSSKSVPLCKIMKRGPFALLVVVTLKEESFNLATQARRSVGSTVKPLMPFASAMERGIVQPGVVVPDVPTNYRGGGTFSNFGGGYAGIPSVRDTITNSRNTPSVRTLWELPEEETYDELLQLGYRPQEDHLLQSYALGAFTATVEQNTNALSTLATGGTRNHSYMIDRIETHTGDVIYEHESEQTEVFSPQTAYLAIDMMRDVVSSGTASRIPGLTNFGGDWAGKTGTSQDTYDYWFVGMNPKVSFGVWLGYSEHRSLQGDYAPRNQRLWATLMNAAVEADSDAVLSDDRFSQPDGIVRQSICGISGLLPSQACYDAGLVNTDLFNSAHLPSEYDDSLSGTRYVTISGQSYLAYDDTPSEFTDTGFSVNSTFFSGVDISNYLPESLSGNLVPERDAPVVDGNPSEVTGVSSSGGTISWAQHGAGDIVGYRIYTASGEHVASVKGNTTTSYSGVSSGQSYYVAAVDTLGRQSGASSVTETEPDEPIEEEEPPESDLPEEDAPSEGDNGNDEDTEPPEETPPNGDDGDDEPTEPEPEPEPDDPPTTDT
ncbi:LOW QUALITY PROTEIN: multimodular transpeptidase-transglycosylase [Geomicrobium sp. JCM 19038]|nr:LOW QUALITY PROTEIN: multimodular transpeptidase-transglycosylase [Geomicrobium sp. JCM 19038]